MNSNFEYYKIFYYVAKYENLTKAATVLKTSQPAVTRTIHKLENELGCRLFTRSKTGMQLTPEGRTFYGYVAAGCAQFFKGENDLSNLISLENGTIYISATETALHCYLFQAMEEFNSLYPNVRFKILNNSTTESVNAVKEGKVENGNIAIIDFEGFNDGVAFEGGKGTNYSLEIGSNTFIPGFEEQLIGMGKNEEKEINVTFPKDYPSEDLKGKDVVFKVKVNEIKEKVRRELDKEFFEDLGMDGVDSLETLEKHVEEHLKEHKKMDNENKFVDEILAKIAENTEVEIPEEMVEHEITHMVENFENQLKMQGISLEVFYEMTKSDEKALRDQMKDEASKRVKYSFILEEIQNKENIKVTEEEINEKAETLAKQYGMEKDAFISAVGGLYNIEYELLMEKTINFLKENN